MILGKHTPHDDKKWYVWFAWYPVCIKNNWIWLEPVARRTTWHNNAFDTWTSDEYSQDLNLVNS